MVMMGMVVFFFGLLSLLMNHKHFLMLLLCFEFMFLGIFCLLVLIVSFSEIYLDLVLFLIIIVCEASLGLSILVMGVYHYGNDKLWAFSMLKC
uniref:NADH dehydrogenase subunit 4L n=1 Tax=Otobius lagophilus TaxID=2944767 RepID=UPI002238E1DB|nr:NADH dehydrogenase subunit 4L [Otobius lagophilus]UYB78388.1 NADH dehydrogenase subunit 4L [Otobius lagophilus]UYB78401.1 NADH dehydrogenase subunit 4L [Otobius lagophilus]UYL27141.1 NADH dehydrogenase subunit 4L [Otobius lagophilus]